jgi:hypothetical protein
MNTNTAALAHRLSSDTAPRRMAAMYMAVHEAAHGVIAISLGGNAEEISILPVAGARNGRCRVSWPDDDLNLKLIVLAAGAAAVSIYKKQSLAWSIFETGMGDYRRMAEIGDSGDHWFKAAKKLCRTLWPQIMSVARAACVSGVLTEIEIIDAMEGAA